MCKRCESWFGGSGLEEERGGTGLAEFERGLESEVDDEPLTDEEIAEIQEALEEVDRGGFVTHEELKRDLGLE
ncbi:hypothetical protein [Methanocalculus sp.]|uniref:hypothetical protein n=1 Tax=Methanocalculus sp. TaxID=2004547 RepID=UPI00260F8035|nr:hypothetical protein [Methanocalculus sp.]MDG6251132.1 hypothetical protein [Methanocalculus sp.]